ncbi:MAG: hypothetical protein AAF789_13945, partial [Bacteroidota bacterium]
MPGKKRNYRLFQVAKELNVGTSLLVEHLQDKGHDIDNSPNSKIDSDLYELLHKQFASEKQMKERADQILEKRKEERIGFKSPEEGGTTEEDGKDPISALDLRNKIKPKRRRGAKTEEPETLPPTAEVTPPVIEESTLVTPEAKASDQEDKGVGLKILDKIDLSQ